MGKKTGPCWLIGLFGVVILLLSGTTVHAAMNTPAEKSYAIEAVLPNNQVDPQVQYWTLQLRPNQRETLTTRVINTGKESLTVHLMANNATTADSANILYSSKQSAIYPKSAVSFASLIVGPREKTVTIPARTIRTVSFALRAPAKTYHGMILGGINSTAVVKTSQANGIALNQQVAYNLSVVLQGEDMDVTPILHFGHVQPIAAAGHMQLALPTNNQYKINISHVQTDLGITNRGSHKFVYQDHNFGMRVAPNSKFDWTLATKTLPPGNYQMRLTVRAPNLKAQTVVQNFTVNQALSSRVTSYS